MFAANEKIKCSSGSMELSALSGNPLVYFLGAAEKPTLQNVERVVFQKHSGRLFRLRFSADLQLTCDQEQRFYYEYDIKTSCFLLCLVDCGGQGLGLSLLEGYPKFLPQSCFFSAKKQDIPWDWQKIWLLSACNTRREALFNLQLLSLQYQLPVISQGFFREPCTPKEIAIIFENLQTSRQLPLLQNDFGLAPEPDFVCLYRDEQDTVFGFYLLDYRYENGSGRHCCFISRGSLTDFPAPELLQKVDSEQFMVKKTFACIGEMEIFLQTHFPRKRFCFMRRHYKAGRMFFCGNISRFFPGTRVLSLFRNQLELLRYQGREELSADELSCVDLVFPVSGAVFINQIAALVNASGHGS
jgi:hypothetical protein